MCNLCSCFQTKVLISTEGLAPLCIKMSNYHFKSKFLHSLLAFVTFLHCVARVTSMSSTLTSYLVAMAIDLALGTPYARLIPASVNRCVREIVTPMT